MCACGCVSVCVTGTLDTMGAASVGALASNRSSIYNIWDFPACGLFILMENHLTTHLYHLILLSAAAEVLSGVRRKALEMFHTSRMRLCNSCIY